jgi:hypothetical protein
MRCHSLAWFRVAQSSKTPWGYREDIETMTLYVVVFFKCEISVDEGPLVAQNL